MAPKTKTKPKLDPDYALLQAEAASHWMLPEAGDPIALLREWVDQRENPEGGTKPPDWKEAHQALDALAEIVVAPDEYTKALLTSRGEVKQKKADWVNGGGLDPYLEARIRLNALEGIQLRDLWRAPVAPILEPLRQLGDRIVTEWLRPQVDYFVELIKKTYPPNLAHQLRFGLLSSEERSVNNAAIAAYPNVTYWWEQVRGLQHRADGLRRVGILTKATVPEGVDKRHGQSPVRYDWAEPLHDMIQGDGHLLREGDQAAWLYAVIVAGRTPTLLTGSEVDARDDGSHDLPKFASFKPAAYGTKILRHSGTGLFGEDN